MLALILALAQFGGWPSNRVMHPVLFHIGNEAIETYSLFAVISMLGAMWAVRVEARRLGWNVALATRLVVESTLLGFAGAHVLYAFTRLDLPSERWWKMAIDLPNGNVWFGGLLAAWAWSWRYARKNRLSPLQVFDVAAFAAMIATILGRFGCFFNGCCYGRPTTLPWGIVFNNRDFFGVPLHPSQLYESLFTAVLFLVLWRLRKKNTRDGQTLARYLIWSPGGRFALEFLRGDSIRGAINVFGVFSLSTSQAIAVPLVCAGIALWIHLNPNIGYRVKNAASDY
jgi:phosphatidylglycerol:prolipoprotein diacylglycerol transferase